MSLEDPLLLRQLFLDVVDILSKYLQLQKSRNVMELCNAASCEKNAFVHALNEYRGNEVCSFVRTWRAEYTY